MVGENEGAEATECWPFLQFVNNDLVVGIGYETQMATAIFHRC